MRCSLVTSIILTTILAGSTTHAEDWPQWLGPKRNATSSETVEPWTGKLEPAWRKRVSEGHSSPIVAKGRVFLHGKVAGKEQEEVIALDAKSGEPIWKQAYDRPPYQNTYGNGPRCTPLVSGDHLITLGASGMLCCWESANGKKVWELDILKEFNAKNLFFGVSSSPLLFPIVDQGDVLLVMTGGENASIVALEKLTGKVLWKSGSDKASYASPLLTKQGSTPMALFLTQKGLSAINPSNGKQFWQFPLVDKLNESSTTPVRVGELAIVSSVTYGMVGLKLENKNGKPDYEQVWKNDSLTCYFATPVVVGEDLYVVTGQLVPPTAKLHCVEPGTGKVLWSKAGVGTYHASLLLAKDRLLLLEEKGDLVLVQPDKTGYKELARSKVCNNTWAHPALANGQIYVRDAKEILCYTLKK